MNLKVTSSVNTNFSTSTSTNIVGELDGSPVKNEQTGGYTVPCTINWWIDVAAMSAKKSNIWPVDNNGNKVAVVYVELTPQETAATNLFLTVYNKAKDLLASTYGWTIVVEA